MGPDSTRDGDVARRLTAVLAADVAGYSRLMAQDELGTLGSLKSLRFARRAIKLDPNEAYFRIDPYVDPAVPERLTADLKKALGE